MLKNSGAILIISQGGFVVLPHIAAPVVRFRSRSGHFLLPRNSCQQNPGSIRRTNYAEALRPFSKFGIVLFVKDFIPFLYVLYYTICVIRRIILSDGPPTTYVLLKGKSGDS